jgi:hypothetical protein
MSSPMGVSAVPSEHSPGGTRERETFEVIERDHGEDPARWLDQDLLQHPGRKALVEARIDGIDSIALVRAWIAVERRLERATRQGIITRLERREEQLQQLGERPERLHYRDDRDVPAKQWYRIEDGERVPWGEVDRSIGLPGSGRAVATDGGDGQ